MRTWGYAFWLSGLILCLTGAALMFFRFRILGEDYAGIATVIGILGIGLLARARK